jgi:hypothetical protein
VSGIQPVNVGDATAGEAAATVATGDVVAVSVRAMVTVPLPVAVTL